MSGCLIIIIIIIIIIITTAIIMKTTIPPSTKTVTPKYYACGKLALCSVCIFSVQLLIERRRLFSL